MSTRAALKVRAGGHVCLVWLEDVIETMRPLATTPAGSGVPGLVGIACVRGAAVPVMDLAALLGAPGAAPRRMVTLRVGARAVGLLVEAVDGLVRVDPAELTDAPPLVRGLADGAVEAIRRADAELALVLGAARLLSAAPPGTERPDARG